MAKSSIKIRAKIKKGACEVKALMKHPMETGQRKNKKTGKKIPAHFIQEVNCTHNGSNVLAAEWGGAISTNPYLSFIFDGASKGDSITLSWIDNQGNKETATAKIK
ncbi:MAG: thiosulfate oxidation carrier complex protein SoxZ [Gammaproteobacteria bacterium]|nr:thiosulfate oxidation carrier complex protein SoxZ [Gammaproteobacteria bacterium]